MLSFTDLNCYTFAYSHITAGFSAVTGISCPTMLSYMPIFSYFLTFINSML